MTQDDKIQLLRENHETLQKNVTPDCIAITEDISLFVGAGDYPRFGFEFFKWRSPEMAAEMQMFLKYAKGKKTFLDIGAFHGIFSLVFTEMNKNGTSFAFEPFVEPFMILSKISRLNNNRVWAIQAALHEYSGQIELYPYGGHLESNKRDVNASPVQCNATTGDAFCFGVFPNISPDIIKIDVEGGELSTLRGLLNTISKNKPIIFLELHFNQLSKEQVMDIMQIICFYEYKIVSVENENEIPLSSLLNQQGEVRLILI